MAKIYPECFQILGSGVEIDDFSMANGGEITRRRLKELEELGKFETIEFFYDRCASMPMSIADFVIADSHLDPRVTDVFDLIHKLKVPVMVFDPEDPLSDDTAKSGDYKGHVSFGLLMQMEMIMEEPNGYDFSPWMIKYLRNLDEDDEYAAFKIGTMMYYEGKFRIYWKGKKESESRSEDDESESKESESKDEDDESESKESESKDEDDESEDEDGSEDDGSGSESEECDIFQNVLERYDLENIWEDFIVKDKEKFVKLCNKIDELSEVDFEIVNEKEEIRKTRKLTMKERNEFRKREDKINKLQKEASNTVYYEEQFSLAEWMVIVKESMF